MKDFIVKYLYGNGWDENDDIDTFIVLDEPTDKSFPLISVKNLRTGAVRVNLVGAFYVISETKDGYI